MTRRRPDLERLLASSGAALRRLAWLLTGESESATELLRDALVATYLAPGGETDAERAASARRELVRAYLRDDGPIGAAEFGIGTIPRREWAERVLADRALLRDLEPPPSVGRPDADEVIAASGPARARRRTRRRRGTAFALVGVLVLVGVGILGNRLQSPVGQATFVELPEQFADVDVASGSTERLRIDVTGSTIDLRFFGKPATWAHARVQAPTSPAEMVPGRVRGMPFYVVRGDVDVADVAMGRTASDVRSDSATTVRAGRWTVIWPSQRRIADTPARPLGLLWRTSAGDRRAALLPSRAPSKDRVALSGGPDGPGALAMSDGRVLALVTEAGVRRTSVRGGHAVLTAGADGDPLPYSAVGYGSVEEVSTFARVVPELSREPGSSPLYVVSVPREAWSDLPERVPVTLREGDKVVHRVELVRGTRG